MISHRTLATAMFVAAGVVGGNAVASSTRTGSSLPPNDAKVTALSVVPDAAAHAGGSRADVVIRVDGAISLKHFTMAKPDKIVIDLAGASLGVPAGDSYDGVARGGITRVRYSQFTKSTVRVVLMLDAPHAYNVAQKDGEVRISVDGTRGKFDSWSIGAGAAKVRATVTEVAPVAPAPVAMAPVAKPQPVTAPAAKPQVTTAAPVTLPARPESLLATEHDVSPARPEIPACSPGVPSGRERGRHAGQIAAVARAAHQRQLGKRSDQRRHRRVRLVHGAHDSPRQTGRRLRHREHHEPAVGRGAQGSHERQRLRRLDQSGRRHRHRHVSEHRGASVDDSASQPYDPAQLRAIQGGRADGGRASHPRVPDHPRWDAGRPADLEAGRGSGRGSRRSASS